MCPSWRALGRGRLQCNSALLKNRQRSAMQRTYYVTTWRRREVLEVSRYT